MKLGYWKPCLLKSLCIIFNSFQNPTDGIDFGDWYLISNKLRNFCLQTFNLINERSQKVYLPLNFFCAVDKWTFDLLHKFLSFYFDDFDLLMEKFIDFINNVFVILFKSIFLQHFSVFCQILFKRWSFLELFEHQVFYWWNWLLISLNLMITMSA